MVLLLVLDFFQQSATAMQQLVASSRPSCYGQYAWSMTRFAHKIASTPKYCARGKEFRMFSLVVINVTMNIINGYKQYYAQSATNNPLAYLMSS